LPVLKSWKDSPYSDLVDSPYSDLLLAVNSSVDFPYGDVLPVPVNFFCWSCQKGVCGNLKVGMFVGPQGLLGGLSNVLETLRGEGAPPAACRAVVHASLRYVDAELLNALMLRRDCCSISAVKALQVRVALCCSVKEH
jgi:hypothetical protein